MSKKLDEAYLEVLDKIADLEAKLAEKDKTIENWQTMYQSVMKSCHNGIEEDKRLREQLAEKDEEIETFNRLAENNKKVAELVSAEHNTKIERLEQQLKFKEKENNILKKIVDGVNKLKEEIVDIEEYALINPKNSFFDGISLSKYLELREKLKQAHQDKISFCIEQLEKVKNYIVTDEKDMFGANYLMNPDYVLEFIDNQIKELKKEMK